MSTTISVPNESTAENKGLFQVDPHPQLAKLIEQWQAGKLWHDDAPRSLVKSWDKLDAAQAWSRWTQYLAKRKSNILSSATLAKADPLDWGLPAGDSPLASVAQWRESLDKLLGKAGGNKAATKVQSQLAEMLHKLDEGPLTAALALQAVATAYRLPQLAGCVDSTLWWRIADSLVQLSEQTSVTSSRDLEAQSMLIATLLSGELPTVLSAALPELKPTRSLRPLARKTLGEGLLAATDGEGLLDAVLLPAATVLFASWTRTRAIGETLKKNCWNDKAETQFEWLVRQTLAMQRVDGSPMLSTDPLIAWPAGVLDTALDLAGDSQDDAAAAARLGKMLTSIDSDFDQRDLPDASVESEWSSLAMLATGWDKTSARLLVDYSSPEMRIELESAGRTLISGQWTSETSLDGKILDPVDEWEQQCWNSDDECDFLDLTLELASGVRLERQFFLGKEDGFLIVHDVLHGIEGAEGVWRHTSALPLAAGYSFKGEDETRDGQLCDAKGTPRSVVMPLSLAEWRTERRFGELAMAGDQLQLTQSAHGARLSCPLWFDLRSRRANKPRTWRQLTVAASLEVAPSDVAVGYRVQVGDAQWLLYRSLANPANRTFMGQNTAAELVIGRFYRTGEFDELLAVDPG